jgi:hypothetical protein
MKCGIEIKSIDVAAEQGWTSYFFDGNKEHKPACPSCTGTLLQEGEDRETGPIR